MNCQENNSNTCNSASDQGHVSSSSQADHQVTLIPIHMAKNKVSGNSMSEQNLVTDMTSRTLQPSSSNEFVQIKMPPIPPTPPRFPKKVNFSVAPSADTCLLRSNSSKKSLLPKMSFKNRNTVSDAAVVPAASASVPHEKSSIARSWSLTKMFSPLVKMTPSLPFTPNGHSDPESGLRRSGGSLNLQTKVHEHIPRSQSVPILNENMRIKRMDSFFRVVPSIPREKDFDSKTPTPIATDDEDGDDIAEDDAVCRICFVELCEGGETLKMECSCKGELALAHHECAVKWFSIKGNKTCDVCHQDVQNLPVTLLRIQSSVRNRDARATASQNHHIEINAYSDIYRVCKEMPILVIVSMLAYFCFLEQLLVRKMGTGSVALSLPFSCVLGLLSSMTSSAMVIRRFAWLYASVQFVFVVVFAHIFYSLVELQPILSILLGTFAGCGVAICVRSIVVEVVRLRRWWRRGSNHQRDSQIVEISPSQSLRTYDMPLPPPPPPPSYIASPDIVLNPAPRYEAAPPPHVLSPRPSSSPTLHIETRNAEAYKEI
uniref:uncharacterized protein LOC122582582 isoform X2 n=1 Tax=Erigeron canadensis TaxID=72917 RepID=UPI001CB90387|nr:uncharacterized protein LOC122582582 isoform X2 [Erigeron canadensis]